MSRKKRRYNNSKGISPVIFAIYADMLEIPLTIVMPASAPSDKVHGCRNFNATVRVEGSNMLEAHYIALHIAKEKSLFYLDGYFLYWM